MLILPTNHYLQTDVPQILYILLGSQLLEVGCLVPTKLCISLRLSYSTLT